jgi:hypothetical protein
VGSSSVWHKIYNEFSVIVTDKTDSSFCRSQSSSASSLDNIVAKEAIQCLTFADTFARKSGKLNITTSKLRFASHSSSYSGSSYDSSC